MLHQNLEEIKEFFASGCLVRFVFVLKCDLGREVTHKDIDEEIARRDALVTANVQNYSFECITVAFTYFFGF